MGKNGSMVIVCVCREVLEYWRVGVERLERFVYEIMEVIGNSRRRCVVKCDSK